MRAAPDATLTIDPPPLASIARSSARSAEEQAVEVDRHRAAPVDRRRVDDVGVGTRRARHVGGQVEPTVLGDDSLDDGVDRGLVGDVERNHVVAGSDVGGHHGRAPRTQQRHRRRADARAAPGDERDLSDHGMNCSGASVKSTTILSMSSMRLLVGLDLLGVRRLLEEGEEARRSRRSAGRPRRRRCRRCGSRSIARWCCSYRRTILRKAGSSAITWPWARQRAWNSSMLRSGWRFTSTVSCSMRSEPFEPVAGVDVQRLAGDGLGQVGSEEQHGAGDLRRVGQVARATSPPPPPGTAPRR